MNLKQVGLLADLGIPAFLFLCMLIVGLRNPPMPRGIDQRKWERRQKARPLMIWGGIIGLILMGLRLVVAISGI
jgi:hypothetical protein